MKRMADIPESDRPRKKILRDGRERSLAERAGFEPAEPL